MNTSAANNYIELIDTTLRDGLQTPGIVLSMEQKLRVVQMLSDAGMKRFESGVPVSGDYEKQFLSALTSSFSNLTFIAWCRASINDIKAAEDSGYTSVHISFPVSPAHIEIPGFTEEHVLNLLGECIAYAQPRFNEISIGAQDASRADSQFLKRFISHAASYSVNRIRIADTVGILSPSSTGKLVTICKEAAGAVDLEFHAHNDLGMATANTITAIENGATCADVTINGIGERAGNAAFEEVVLALTLESQYAHSIDTSKLVGICTEFAEMIKQPIPPCKPVIGRNLFCHESGIHTHGLLKDRSSYEPYDASLTGHDPTMFVGGTQSGITGIRYILHSHNVEQNEQSLKSFVKYLKERSLLLRKTFSDSEIVNLYREFEQL